MFFFALIFFNSKLKADPPSGLDQAAQMLEAGASQIDKLANLTTEEQKQLVMSLFQQYKHTLDFIIKTNGTAGEKRAQVQSFIESIEKVALTKVTQLHGALATVNTDELYDLVTKSPEIEKVISKSNALLIVEVIKYLKIQSGNVPEFEKRIHLLATVLNDVVDIWGNNVYNALSTDPSERAKGRVGLTNDFYYFKREYMAILGIVRIMMDTNSFRDMKPKHMSQLAEYIQEMGLLYIKFAQSMSNIAIPIMKAQAKLEKADSSNVKALQQTIDKLKEFQDGLPPVSPEYAESIIKKQIVASSGRKKEFLQEILKNIDFNKPLKSGTIGTTYMVKVPVTTNWLVTKTSHDEFYVVKIARPALREEIEHGQKLFKSFLTLSGAVFPAWLQWVPRFLTSCFDSVSYSFQDETNFAKEAVNMRKFKMLLMLSSVKVPAVNYAAEDLLVMEAVTEGENFDAFIEREKDDKYMKFLEQVSEIENHYYSYDDKIQKEQKEQAFEKLYADNPENKRKMDTFAKIYGEFLEGTVYMALAMGQVHADLHPGNILIKNVNGEYTLHFIDWGNTVDINGLIMDPIFLAAYTALGNSREMAHRLYDLRDPKSTVTEEQIHKIIAEVMIENKLDAKGKTILKKVLEFIQILKRDVETPAVNGGQVSAETEKSAEEKSKTMSEIGSQIFMRLLKETDYIVSGKAIQFIRTILPVGSSANKIISALPNKEVLKLSFKNANKGFFLGYLKALILKHPAQMRSLVDEIKYGIDEKTQTLARASVRTENEDSETKGDSKTNDSQNANFGDFSVGMRCEDLGGSL
jgi:predicted unusual protein kinase regulating ubiquinone biosynthesis (AarF/ABC1/UbiB family)